MADFYDRLQPGVIRLHHYGLVTDWVDNGNKRWNKERIKTYLDNAKDTYKHGSRVIITLDAPPDFISTVLPLTEAQEDETAAFFAQLPGIIKELGYTYNMYEFFNEKENAYASDRTAYWRVLNKIAVAIKAADPTAKCGGPAESWPTLYGSFIDNCSQNMDFVSFHLYARGPGNFADDDLFTGAHQYRSQVGAAGNVARYLKSKGITHMESFLDEFNVQYVWEPYQPAHHNHIGASWMACFIKNVALQGVTGLNVWNTQDTGAYGLNYNSAPANLYLMSRQYLRGDVVESSDSLDRVEMIPVISENGERSILFVNRMGQKTTVIDAKTLIGGNEATIKGMRLDHTTSTANRVYITETMTEVPTDIVLNPYGMVLLTNVGAGAANIPPKNIKAAYVLENEIALTWSSDAVTRQGFRIACDNKVVEDINAVVDTVYVLKGLQPGTTYNITVSTIDEYGDVYPSGESSVTVSTRKMPLKINDRTVGAGLHQFNYDKNWIASTSTSVYNKDITTSKSTSAVSTIRFKGHAVALFGSKKDINKFIRIYVDDVLKKELTNTTALDFGGFYYYDETLTDSEHALKIEADAAFSLDRLDVFGSTFENVTTNPDKVENVAVLSTTRLISLSWPAPAHQANAGIQYYRILTTIDGGAEVKADTVYSPEFTITELEEATEYPVTIEAYDPCGNKSVSAILNLSTLVKNSVEIAKAPGSITIDGLADEESWNAAQRLDISNSINDIPEKDNLSGWFKILWAQHYLYIYIDVTDNVKVARTNEDSELNENDGFELFLDGGNRKSGLYDLRDAWIKALYNPIQYEEYNNVRTVEYAVATTATGYGIEIRYNLTDLGLDPGSAGKELGLDIHLNDNDKTDSYGLDNKLTWQKKSENASLNKALLGDMVFVETLTSSLNPISSDDNVSIYPNPAVNQLNIAVNEEKFKVVVYNITGNSMAQHENQKQMDVSGFASGLYIIRLFLPKRVVNRKFLKK
jgi:hypothetical protein